MVLLFSPSPVPIQVDAYLADGHDRIQVKHGTHFAKHVKIVVVYIFRVQTQRHRDVVRVLLMQSSQARNTLQILIRQDDVAHTSLSRTLHYVVPILVKRIAIDM